jgi:hypothetical protein
VSHGLGLRRALRTVPAYGRLNLTVGSVVRFSKKHTQRLRRKNASAVAMASGALPKYRGNAARSKANHTSGPSRSTIACRSLRACVLMRTSMAAFENNFHGLSLWVPLSAHEWSTHTREIAKVLGPHMRNNSRLGPKRCGSSTRSSRARSGCATLDLGPARRPRRRAAEMYAPAQWCTKSAAAHAHLSRGGRGW